MSEFILHRVTSVQMQQQRFEVTADNPEEFCVHRLVVQTEDGERSEIKLFTFDTQLRLDSYTLEEPLDPRRGEERIADNE